MSKTYDISYLKVQESKALKRADLFTFPDCEPFSVRSLGKDLLKVFQSGQFQGQFKKGDFTEIFPIISSYDWPKNADGSSYPEGLIEEVKHLNGAFVAGPQELRYLIPLAIRILSYSPAREKEPKAIAIEAASAPAKAKGNPDPFIAIMASLHNPLRHLFITKRFSLEAGAEFQPMDWKLFGDQCVALSTYTADNLKGYLKNKKGHYVTKHSPFKLQEYYFDGHGNRVFYLFGKDAPEGVDGLGDEDLLFVSFLSGSDHDKVNRKLESMTLGAFALRRQLV